MQSQQTDSYTPDQVSQLLNGLLQPDTNVVAQATKILKAYFKKVQALENLLILMSSSPDTNIR